MSELDLHRGDGPPPIVLEAGQRPGQLCGCDQTQLCDRCRASSFEQLRGVAACRGEAWAERVARTVSRSKPWPPWSDKVAAIAMRQVGDLAADAKLQVLLAVECANWAARRWTG